jgi:uncharacterized protein (TIGR00106 family)
VVIAELSIHPIGKGTSVGRYVKAAVTAVSKIKGLRYEVTPMSTVLESEKLETVLQAVIVAHRAVRALGARRVSSLLRIDERLDKPRVMRDKVRAVTD